MLTPSVQSFVVLQQACDMSTIDFSMDIQREADPKGDQVKVVLSGKFLPYKSY
jgi:cyanate lyase